MSYRNKILRATMICYMSIVVLFVLVRMLSAFGLLNFLYNTTGEIVLNLVIQIGLLFCVSIFLFAGLTKEKVKNVFSFYGFKKVGIKIILLSVAIGVVVYILNILITTFFNAFLSTFGYSFSQSGSTSGSYPFWLLIVNILVTAVLPAVCEETAHRGMLLRGLMPLGVKKAFIFSSIFFGLLHLNIEQVFYATLIGFLIGYISLRTFSIVPAMIIHFMNNAVSAIMGYSAFHKIGLEWGFNVLDSMLASNPIMGVLVMILIGVALFFLLRFLLLQLFRISHNNRMSTLQWAMIQQYEREKYLKDVENISKGIKCTNEEVVKAEFFDKFDRTYGEKAVEIGMKSEIDLNLEKDKSPSEFDKIAKVMLITTLVIVGVITLFTLIWGML